MRKDELLLVTAYGLPGYSIYSNTSVPLQGADASIIKRIRWLLYIDTISTIEITSRAIS